MTLDQAAPERMHDLAGGEELNWDAVYADQAPRVYNYFRFRLGRDADVEDLTARTFERAWRSRAKYNRDLAAFSTWLFKIAQNLRIDFLQSSRGQLLPIDAALDVAADGTPEKDAERNSDLARLSRLTRELPDRERELIALKYGAAINNRLIAHTEFNTCTRSIGSIAEVEIGHQAIVLARSKLYGAFALTPTEIFLALAAEIPDPAHPDKRLYILEYQRLPP